MTERDLRSELLHAASELVDAEGLDALTLRALSARVGVSRQAPYLHFADKRALLAAVAGEGLRIERRWAIDAMASASGPTEALMAILRAHMRLRREHPGVYKLAHGAIAKHEDEQLQKEAIESFALVRGALQRLSAEVDIAVVRRRCMILWGLARGLAELDAMASRPASVTGDPDQWLEEGVTDLLRAWSVGGGDGANASGRE